MPKRYGISNLISYALVIVDEVGCEELESYRLAMNNSDKSIWITRMKKEIASLKKNNNWTWSRNLQIRSWWSANRFLNSNKGRLVLNFLDIRPDLLQKGLHRRREWILMRCIHL